MTVLDPYQVGLTGSWFAMGLGAAMVLYAWIAERHDEMRKHRLNDCGLVLIFAANLVLILVKGGPQHALEWFMMFASPIIVAAALWRLSHTSELQ
ncbi:MAG TPA: hypothetical protein VEA15_07475 [Caulobacteraceae bacterium]|nr:hypothetical protein [Caulobacteraceae bacterium]